MKKITMGTIACLCLVLAFWACNKAQKNPANVSSSPKKLSSTVSMPCTPTVVDGILTFVDTSQYLCYEAYLDSLINNNSDSSLSDDDILGSIEGSLGFSSLRASALASFNIKNAAGWATEAQIPQEDWISSRVTRSMLNTNREIKIGAYIEKYMSPKYLVDFDATQTKLLTSLRGLGSDPSVEDIINLDLNRDYINISSLTNPDGVWAAKPTGPVGGNTGTWPDTHGGPITINFWQSSGTLFEEDRCAQPGKITFSGFTTSHNFAPQKCSYHFVYGDGTATGTVSEPDKVGTLGASQSIVNSFFHTYAQGTYHVTVTIKSISPVNSGNTVVLTRTYTVVVGPPPVTCTKDTRSAEIHEAINPSNVIWGYIEYKSWNTAIFGAPRTRITGWTELHAIDGNGSWNRVKNNHTQLCVVWEQSFGDADCNSVFRNNPTNQCKKNTNQKELEVNYGSYQNDVLRLKRLHSVHSVSVDGGVSGASQQEIVICQ